MTDAARIDALEHDVSVLQQTTLQLVRAVATLSAAMDSMAATVLCAAFAGLVGWNVWQLRHD